jgi:hypothetical protein
MDRVDQPDTAKLASRGSAILFAREQNAVLRRDARDRQNRCRPAAKGELRVGAPN